MNLHVRRLRGSEFVYAATLKNQHTPRCFNYQCSRLLKGWALRALPL